MREQDDHSYLSNPLIPDTEYIINDNQVKITCPSTIYVHVNLSPPVIREEAMTQYKRVLGLAKEKKISISYRAHIRRNIRERWEEYMAACATMKTLFARIIKQSKVVKERGLHFGTRDDVELEKLQHLCWDFDKLHRSGSVVSLVSDILYQLENIAADLSKPEYRWDRITL